MLIFQIWLIVQILLKLEILIYLLAKPMKNHLQLEISMILKASQNQREQQFYHGLILQETFCLLTSQ